jgi:hypothetical protein
MKWTNSVARRFFHCPQLEVPFYLLGSDVELNSLYATGMGSQTCYFVWRTRTTKSFGHTSVLIKTRTDYTFSTFIVTKLTGAFSAMQPEVSSPSSRIATQRDWRHSTFWHSVYTSYIYLYCPPVHIYSSLKLSNKSFFFSSGLADLMLGYAGLYMQLGLTDTSRTQN